MKALKDKVNTVPPGGDYPYGDLRDNPGDNSGTPVNRDLMGDIHRTVEKIMDEAGIVANGLDDNEANGYQIYEALLKATRGYEVTSYLINPQNTGNEVIVLKDDLNIGAVSYSNPGVGRYELDLNNISAINAHTVYSITNISLTAFEFGFFDAPVIPNRLTIRSIDQISDSLKNINRSFVLEIRKYI